MKTMTCKQLGGACDQEFSAATFEEIAEMSKQHGMDMFQKGDQPHLDAMQKMRERMKTADSDEMNKWMSEKRAEFDALPNVK